MANLFIGGAWRAASSGAQREVVNPFDQSVVAKVDEATADDVAAAVAAARDAFDAGEWARTPARERGDLLDRVADLLLRDKEEIAQLETRDTGKTLGESRQDVDDVAAVFRYYADLADKDPGRLVDAGRTDVVSRVVYEPVGVCALIAPWNYPLLQISWKVAPALAAGNTVVVKPSEVTPLTTIHLVKLLAEAGAPAGVVNLVLGDGKVVGAAMVEDPAVDMVSFTGGVATGQWILRAAAETVKKVTVELGGKNPNIVFADVDFDTAVDHALTAVFLHSGQVCSAGARLIVQDEIHDAFVAAVAERAERIRLGSGFDDATESGPLVSAQHRETIERYVATGIEEGARLVAGGRRPEDPELAGGFFYRPTVFADCRGDMRIVQEESFGPVMTVERFSTEADAIRLGNDTHYGLAGAVWTADAGRAERVARALRHGTVWINDYHPYLPQAEWGGFGRSGNGRELGPSGLNEYREAKHIWHNTAPQPSGWFTA
ncbi:aldehyde dehydrogenase family protein [Blastococcus deserti]|uniref:Aldehyde dehydrogenase family protein n=1 Tax=Blastococcus deserti TaxID=2259033 RepID=A0ABW4XGG6_9ACTN